MTSEPEASAVGLPLEHAYIFQTDTLIANRYKVIAPLGFGGFSEVYRCIDNTLGREVAVKVLTKGEVGLKEARAAAKLNHKNIVEVYDVSPLATGQPIIVFEYVSGETLEKRMSDAPHRRLPLDSVTLQIIQQVAEALDYAHTCQIIHRDIKPSNVIIDAAGDAHLTDFGLAEIKLTDEQRGSMMTTDVKERMSGTIPYMSPEQLKDNKLGDEKSDQYSLGIVAYEMLTGRLPYPGHDTALMIQIVTAPPQPPTSLNPDLPKGVGLVLLRALSKKPEDRYPSCSEFAKDLAAASEKYLEASVQYEEAIQSG